MRALKLKSFDGPAALELGEAPDPPPPTGTQVCVQVKASALNRADLLQTLGLYPAPKGISSDVPGMEYSGVVKAIGPEVKHRKIGDRVMGLVAGAAWAEALITDEQETIPLPASLSFEQGAAIPEAFITAIDAVSFQAGLSKDQTLLIHAVASGVGTAAVQWAKVIGARSIGTSRDAKKLERVRELGLDVAIEATSDEGNFAAKVLEVTGALGANVVLDLVGGTYLQQTIEATAPKGTIMLVGLVAGASAEVPLRTLLAKRITLRGTSLRNRPLEEKIAVAQAFVTQVLPHFESGALKPVVDSVVPMSEARTALERMQRNETFGKTVIEW